MMETVSKQQPYSPHLKKVLKTYQLSAVKSLQGPSTLLGTGTVSGMDKIASATSSPSVTLVPKKEPVPEVVKVAPPTTSAPECGDVFMTPPPFPIQQLPILTTPDQSRSELSETVLEGETISCFVVGGEKRLCLPQVLNSVLREFSLCQINQVCEELQIFCSRCNPEQLEVLKVTGILPMTAPSCGLITKTDAERLSSALLHRSGVHVATGGHKGALSFKVYHECFGKCKGICTPELYTDNNAHCIECVECHGMFSPQKFVCHVHQFLENRTCHWGFDSSNWRSYLLIAKDQEEHEKLAKVLDEFKEQHDNTANNSQHKRKQTHRWQGSTENSFRTSNRKRILEEEILHTADATDRWEKIHQPESDSKEPHELQVLKKPKLDAAAEPYGTYLYPVADPQNHILWYESWSRMSAFRPWPSIHTKEGKGQPPPPPVVRESVPTSVPTYLSHSPPVLLHPERVVPMSESERFEPCFQPNVALAPIPQQHRSRIETTKMEVKMEDLETELEKKPKKSSGSPVSPSSAVPAHDAHSITATSAIAAAGGPTLYNPEIELSTDTDDSSSDMAAEPAPVRKECKSLVDEVVAVLGNVDNTRDAARDRVVKIVEDLVMRQELQETKIMQLQEEVEELTQLCLEHGIRRFNSHRMGHITELRHPIKQDPDIVGGSQGRHNRMPSTGGSPVSVITSPPPVVKSEPASSE